MVSGGELQYCRVRTCICLYMGLNRLQPPWRFEQITRIYDTEWLDVHCTFTFQYRRRISMRQTHSSRISRRMDDSYSNYIYIIIYNFNIFNQYDSDVRSENMWIRSDPTVLSDNHIATTFASHDDGVLGTWWVFQLLVHCWCFPIITVWPPRRDYY